MSQADNTTATSGLGSMITPKMVRETLSMDNSQIQELCKFAAVKPKRDARGLSYFTKEDLEVMKNFSGMKSKLFQSKLALMSAQKPEPEPELKPVTTIQKIDDRSIQQIMQSLRSIETAITDKVAAVMDEKLDGMDDVILELIRCKTENETLRYKINELNKENYNLKNNISRYKSVGFNVYVKTS